LEWELEWGQRRQDLERIAARGVVVAALENRPTVPEYLQDYWHAYLALDASRHAGYVGPQPLLHSEIESYARLHGWAWDDTVILAFLCRQLDNRYLSRLAERRKAEAERGNAKGGNRRTRS